MKIALLGGGFDPPHMGHLLLSTQIREHMGLDQVWLIPCFEHPFEKKLSPATDRLAMVKLIESDHIKASDIEIEKGDTSYTINTLSTLNSLPAEALAKEGQFSNHTFSWIIGSDQLPHFHKWKEWEKLRDEHQLIIFPRETPFGKLEEKVKEYLKLEKIPTNIQLVCDPDIIVTNVSSTIIRQKVREGKSIKYLVDIEVERYIKERSLYKV